MSSQNQSTPGSSEPDPALVLLMRFGLPTDQLAPTEVLLSGMRGLGAWVRGLNRHAVVHGSVLWSLTRCMGLAAGRPVGRRLYGRIRRRLRRCDECILLLANRMARHPGIFRRFLGENPDELPEILDAFAWRVIRAEETVRQGSCHETFGELRRLEGIGPYVPHSAFSLLPLLLPDFDQLRNTMSHDGIQYADVLGTFTARALGDLAFPYLHWIVAEPCLPVRAYASAAICALPPASQRDGVLMTIAHDIGNPFAERAVALLGHS